MNRSEITLMKMSVIVLFLAVSSLGCATKQQNLMDPYTFNNVEGARDVHLQQEAASLKMEAPKELPEMTSEEHERLGDLYFRRGDLGTAFVQYEKALKHNPENSGIHYKKGLLLVVGKMNEDAILEFRLALEQDSKHASSYEGMGLAYFQMNKYEDAEACLCKAAELDPKLWKAHNFLGIIYDNKKEYKKAIREYQAAIAVKDNNGLLYNNLGISYFRTGDYEKAVAAFNKGLARRPAHRKIYNNLGLVLAEMGRYPEALEAFRKGGDEAQAYNNLGCIYLKHGKYEEAQRCFEKAVELKPTFYAKASENARKARLAHGPAFDLSFETSFDDRTPARKMEIKKRTWKKPDWLRSGNSAKENTEESAKGGAEKEISAIGKEFPAQMSESRKSPPL